MNTKICTQCNRELLIENFWWKNKKRGYRQSECIDCGRKRTRRNYEKNKQYYLDKNKLQIKKQKKWYREYKSTLKCERCPEDHPACLDFHHINEDDKKIEVSRMIYSTYSIKRLKEEIDKCMVLCANCHRKLHYDDRNS